MKIALLSLSLAAALALSACTRAPDQPEAGANVAAGQPTPVPASAAPAPAPTEAAPAVRAPTPASDRIIGLEGLGDLRIGAPIPAGSSWAERGAQTGAACRTVSSPPYPGIYAIVSDGVVRRITVGARSDVKLVEGVGVGSSEAEVGKWFGGFRSEPHKYVEAPAKYLTAPNAASGDPAVRFEIGQDGRVSLIHVGTMPVLGYVEGCS